MDIAKGLLILLVVMGHIPVMFRNIMTDNYQYISYYDIPHSYVRCFFMQAFFVLTGLTTNFERPFPAYLKRCLKGILVPYLFFSCITFLVGRIFWEQSPFYHIGEESYLFVFEDFWFLQSLFTAKILYYIVRRSVNNCWITGSILLLFVLISISISYGYADHESPSHFHNYFHYRNALAMCIFVWLGDMFRGGVKLSLLRNASVVFLVISIVSFVLIYAKLPLPQIIEAIILPVQYTHESNLNSLLSIPSYLIYAVTGTAFVFYIAILISNMNCRMIEYFGRNSIVVYCLHFTFLQFIIRGLYGLIVPSSVFLAILFFLLCLALTVLLCGISIWFFNLKYVRCLIGKW